MKKHKILQVLLAVVVTCLLSACVGINSSSQEESSLSSQEESTSSQEETFWEGQVQPGVYKGYWREELPVGEYDDVECSLTIYEDQSVRYREEIHHLWGRRETTITVYYGTICKCTEVYDGDRKVWYAIEAQENADGATHIMSTGFNLSTNMEYSEGDHHNYQDYSSRKKCFTFKKNDL